MVAIDAVRAAGPTPTDTPTAKVLAASGGSAVGGALGTIINWLIDSHHLLSSDTVPANVQTAISLIITALCSAALAGAAGWLKRPGSSERLTIDGQNRPQTASV